MAPIMKKQTLKMTKQRWNSYRVSLGILIGTVAIYCSGLMVPAIIFIGILLGVTLMLMMDDLSWVEKGIPPGKWDPGEAVLGGKDGWRGKIGWTRTIRGVPVHPWRRIVGPKIQRLSSRRIVDRGPADLLSQISKSIVPHPKSFASPKSLQAQNFFSNRNVR